MSILVNLGADPEVVGQHGLTLLQTAIDFQDEEKIDLLLQLGASPNTPSQDGTPPLLLALSHKHLAPSPNIISRLLEAGADPNIVRPSDGITPLMKACQPQYRNPNIVQMLIGNGAQLEIRDTQSRTALHHSNFSQNAAVLDVLVKAGADLNVVDKRGLCMWTGLVKDLVDGGPDVKSRLQTYLECGADPNIVTSSVTPGALMTATVTSLGAEGVQMLLSHGADLLVEFGEASPYTSPFTTALENLPSSLPSLHLLLDGLYFTSTDTQLCSATDSPHLGEVLRQMREIPFLTQLCRREIHQALGARRNRHGAVESLPVALKLHRYILFQDSQIGELTKHVERIEVEGVTT